MSIEVAHAGQMGVGEEGRVLLVGCFLDGSECDERREHKGSGFMHEGGVERGANLSHGESEISTQKKVAQLRKEGKPSKDQVLSEIKARKIRTRHLIEMGGLIVKAQLDHLDSNVLLGALIYAKEELDMKPQLREAYAKLGNLAFNRDKRGATKVILRFEEQPEGEVRKKIRELGMKWHFQAKEWHGHVKDVKDLRDIVRGMKCNMKTL